jgi:hypothetical protein
MPPARELHWDRAWEHVRRQPLLYIFGVVYSSFSLGLGSAVLLGPNAFRCTPRGLIVYVTVGCCLNILLWGYVLMRAVAKRRNDTVQPPPGT